MKEFTLLLRKIRREVGINLIYVIWCALKVIFYSIKPAPRSVRAALKKDYKTLLDQQANTDALLQRAKFYHTTASGDAQPLIDDLKRLTTFLDQHRDKDKYPDDEREPWRKALSHLARLASMTWNDANDVHALQQYVAFFHEYEQQRNEKNQSLFRYYRLNKGKNDHWEWYLVPWHRAYGMLTVAMLDERLRPMLLPIWKHHDRWHRDELPWMMRFLVGSNVAAANSGYALHALMGFLLDDDPNEKKKYLSRYRWFARRLYKVLAVSFDVDRHVSIPFEGVLYGGFMFRTPIILGLMQRALGLDHCLLDAPHLAGLSEYSWKSKTPEHTFQTSGDSKATLDEGAIDQGVFGLLAELEDHYAKQLAGLFPRSHYLAGKIKDELKGEDRGAAQAQCDLIVSRRKGEVLLNFQNETYESIMVVFHANTINPLVNTLHFGLKPGHLFVYAKRRGEAEGRWVLTDAGYVNYFRPDQTEVELPIYNTLDKQKLIARGWLRVRERGKTVELRSFSLLPLHRRVVTFSYDDTNATLAVKDVYLGNRRVNWNVEQHGEQTRAFFRQTRQIEL